MLTIAIVTLITNVTLRAQTPYAVINPGQTDYNSNLAVYPDHDGNFYLISKSYYAQDLDPGIGVTTYGPPYQQVLIAKYTDNMTLLWSAHIEQAGILNPKAAYVLPDNSIQLAGTSSTDLIIYSTTGTSTLVTQVGQPMWTVRLDSDGGLVNAISVGGPNGSSAPYPYSVTANAAGDITITGTYIGNVDFDPGAGTTTLSGSLTDGYGFIAKYAAAGTLLWVKKLGLSSNYCTILDHTIDQYGNIILGGWFTGTVDMDHDPLVTHNLIALGSGDGFFAKYNADGNYLWSGALAENMFYGGVNEIETDPSGNIYISGFMDKPCDFDIGVGVKTRKPHGTGFYIAKYKSDGVLKWVRQPAGNGDFLLHDLYVDSEGNALCSGTFSGTFDFDFGNTTYEMSGPDVDLLLTDQWFSSHDKNGDFNYAFSLQTDPTVIAGISSIYSIGVTTTNKLIIAGKYLKSMDIDPGPGTWMISIPGADQSGFVIAYDQPAFKESAPSVSGITISPNPVDDVLHITAIPGDQVHMNMYDMQGRKMISVDITSANNTIDIPVNEFPEGMYFVSLMHDGITETNTVVVAH